MQRNAARSLALAATANQLANLVMLATALACSDAAHASDGGVADEAVTWIGIHVDPARIVDQHLHPSDSACVPATLLNALRFGPENFQHQASALPGTTDRERLESIVTVASAMPSHIEPGQPTFSENNGVRADDIPLVLAQLLTGGTGDAPRGTYLDRHTNESGHGHLTRIHSMPLGLLAAGVPVVLSMGAFGATSANDQKDFTWNGLGAHAVLIIALPKALSHDALGCPMRYVDPWTASIQEGYIRSEEVFRSLRSILSWGSSSDQSRPSLLLRLEWSIATTTVFLPGRMTLL